MSATPTPTLAVAPAVPGAGIKLGVTLYSLTSQWAAGLYDLPALLDTVDAAGIGPGIEIVASQTLRTYPHVTDRFVHDWREAFDRHGFVPSSFGANLDMGRRRDRDMTIDEEFEFTEAQFRSAAALGFPLVRIQSAKPDLIRRLLPLTEELDLTLGWEIHAPMGPSTPDVVRVRETYAEFDSPRLGFVADFSSTMHDMSPALFLALTRMGLERQDLTELARIWAKDDPIRDRQEEFLAYLGTRGIDPASIGPFARLAFNMHGHVAPAEWSEIMPQIVHVHAKFYDIDEHGDEPAIDYPAIVREFVRGGYDGFFSSEWEGHAFVGIDDAEPVRLVQGQHALIRRSIEAALAERE